MHTPDIERMRCTAKRHGRVCGEELFYKKTLSFGKTTLLPIKVYNVIPASLWLESLFKQQQFNELIKKAHEHHKGK